MLVTKSYTFFWQNLPLSCVYYNKSFCFFFPRFVYLLHTDKKSYISASIKKAILSIYSLCPKLGVSLLVLGCLKLRVPFPFTILTLPPILYMKLDLPPCFIIVRVCNLKELQKNGGICQWIMLNKLDIASHFT